MEIGDKETSQEALVHIRKDAGLSVPRNYCSEWSQHRDLNPYLQNLTPLFPRGRKLAQQSCILFKSQSLLEGFAGSSNSKESACNARDSGLIPGSGISPGEAPHSSILAWRIPWTKEPCGSQSMGLQRVRLDWRNNTFTLLENKIIWIYIIMKNTCRNLVFYFKGFFCFVFFCCFREWYEILFHLKSTALGSLKVNLILLEPDFHYKQKGSVIPPRHRRTRDSNQMTSSLISNTTILPGSYSLKSVKNSESWKVLDMERQFPK